MTRTKWRNALKSGILLLCSLLFITLLSINSPAWALISRSAEQVVVGANETLNDDLYVAGDTITIDGRINGDLIAAGRLITVNGNVQGDVLAVGQAVVINGNIGDDLRVASQVTQLNSNAQIGDDLVAAGFSLETQAGSRVASDLNFAGVQALLAGSIGQVTAATSAVELRGTVAQNVNVITGHAGDTLESFYPPFFPQPPVPIPQLRAGLNVADSARIGGNLTYRTPDTVNISSQAQIAGSVVRKAMPVEVAAQVDPGQVIFQHLQRFVALLLVGWLLLRFVPSWIQNLAVIVQTRPLPSLVAGIAVFLVLGVIAIALLLIAIVVTVLFAVTLPSLILPVIGLGMLANLMLFTGFVLFVGFVPQIVLSLLLGYWLLHKLQSTQASRRYVALAVGLLAFVILSAIPAVGQLLNLVIVLLGLGALWIWARNRRDRTPKDFQLTNA